MSIPRTALAFLHYYNSLPPDEQRRVRQRLVGTSREDAATLDEELGRLKAKYRRLRDAYEKWRKRVRRLRGKIKTLRKQLAKRAPGKRGPYKAVQLRKIRRLRVR